MPKLNLDDEIANAWEAYVKSEQPDEPRNPKKIVDVFDLIFGTKWYALDLWLKTLYNIIIERSIKYGRRHFQKYNRTNPS